MNLSYQYDKDAQMFVVCAGSRVLDADSDGGSLGIRYGFLNSPVELGTQPGLDITDYEEYASYSYSYVKPVSPPGIEGFLDLNDALTEPKEYSW